MFPQPTDGSCHLLMQVLGGNAAVQPAGHPTASLKLAQPEPARGQSAEQQRMAPLAFLCCLQEEGVLVMALDCPTQPDQAELSRHPAVLELAQHPLQ